MCRQGVAGTGVVGHLGTGPGPVVMLRADMDGLPIQWTVPQSVARAPPVARLLLLGYRNLRDWTSNHSTQEPCTPAAMMGSDMAMLLGAARLLKAREQLGQVHGRVKLVLQPFEEGGAGADKMVKHGEAKCCRPLCFPGLSGDTMAMQLCRRQFRLTPFALFTLVLSIALCRAAVPYHELLQSSLDQHDWLISVRRELHSIPELGSTEHKTAAVISRVLQELGVQHRTGVWGTGVVAAVGTASPTVMVRADIDALPIEEPDGLAFRSQHHGVMHACGHDGHTAMLLGAARLLKALEPQLKGQVRLVWQPDEEKGCGASHMVEQAVPQVITIIIITIIILILILIITITILIIILIITILIIIISSSSSNMAWHLPVCNAATHTFGFTAAQTNSSSYHCSLLSYWVLEGVQAAFGLHVMPFLPSGVFASRPGTIMAGALSFHINITGRGGHAAMPHLNVDPVVAAAAVITALQTLVSRETSPLGSAVLSVTLLRAGDSYNVIPDVAQLGGTIRALDHEAMMRLQSRVGSLSKGVAQGYGCSAEVDWRQDQQPYYPPTVNDAAVERVTQQMAAKLLGADKVVQVEPIMPAEDFSFYCQQVPCTFGFLGIRNETLGSVHNLHSPQFLLDESVLHKGAALHAAWALTYLDLLNAEALEASGSGQAPDAPNGLAARDELPRQEGISVRQANFSTNATAVATAGPRVENEADLNQRHHNVSGYFPSALGVDDFMARVEVALSGFGFTGENSIAMTNLCRDEVTTVLKDKIESVFGGSFNTNGLGAVLTCGVTGMGAGFSHSPVSNGKEHYVFFAFPHIGINSAGEVGAITRPGRPVKSCACGALQKCLIELKAEGYSKNCKVPGVHDPLDPEYSILKQRLARRVRYENIDPTKMDLVSITGLAERTITNDIEYLIEKAVDFKKANIAVVTGVQIHNWATELDARSGVPSLEFVAPAKVFVVVDGRKTFIDLSRVPTMSPRQLQLMAKASVSGHKDEDQVAIGKTVAGTLKEIPLKYLTQRLGVTKDPEELTMPGMSYTWTAGIIADEPDEDHSEHTSFSQTQSWQFYARGEPSCASSETFIGLLGSHTLGHKSKVIKVPEGAVLRGCKKNRRKLMAHFQLRAEVHSQLRVIVSLFVLRIFLTCLVGYPTPGYRSAPYPHSPRMPLPSLPLPSLPAGGSQVYNQLQRRLVCKGQRRHPLLMPVFGDHSNQELLAKLRELGNINLRGHADTIGAHSMQLARFVKMYAKAARAKLGWSGEEARLFIKIACGYGINPPSSELQAATLDNKGHVVDLLEEADKHRRLLGMKKQGAVAAAFHPTCARAAKARQEAWGWSPDPDLPTPLHPHPHGQGGVHFVKVDSRVLHGVCKQLGLTKETQAAFTSETALSHNWTRWFNTHKLRTKDFAVKRMVETDGVSVCVHYTRPLPPPPAPPPAASSRSRPSAAAAAAALAVGLPHIGRGIAETREYVFDPDTQIGVGIDPGVTQAVSAASGVWDPQSGQLMADQLRRWKLTKGQVKHASVLNNARRDTERWLAPTKPHLQHLAAASSAGTSLEANLKHITVTLATWDAVWEVYLDPKWARQRLRLYGAQDRALEPFFNKLEKDMAEVSMERHGRAKQLVVFFGAACISTGGGWGADAVLRACCKVVCRPRGRVVLVGEHRTTRVSSAVNGQQSCEEQPTRRAGWKPPKGQVDLRLLRPAWSQQRDQPVRGLIQPAGGGTVCQPRARSTLAWATSGCETSHPKPSRSSLLWHSNGPNSLLPTAKLQDLSVGALYGSGYRNMQAKVKAADSVIQGMGSRLGPYTGRGVTLGGAMGNTLKTATGSPADSGVVYEYPTGTYTSKSGLPPLAYKPWSTEYVDEYRTPAAMKDTLSRMTEHYGTGDALRTSRFQHQGYPPSFNALESSLGKRGQTGPRHESRVVAF
ncbi:hypothetical protein QJQ45_029740 [Haematococcus lacustris]|nr:hypothetical protein QJQ45_029740 [Haematococcus lacustris]